MSILVGKGDSAIIRLNTGELVSGAYDVKPGEEVEPVKEISEEVKIDTPTEEKEETEKPVVKKKVKKSSK